jgi:hypothetical protein
MLNGGPLRSPHTFDRFPIILSDDMIPVTDFSVTGATATFADSMATGNARAGILIGAGTSDVSQSQLFSYGDNEIDNNGTNVSGGTLAPLAKR